MRRLTVAACSLVGALAGVAPDHAHAQQKSASDVFAEASRSVVVVNGVDVYGQVMAQGSGVITASSLVVTNCHVLRGAFAASVRHNDQEHPATVLHMDAERDVCSLTVAGLEAQAHLAMLPSDAQMNVGDRVYAIGAPRGLELSLSEGLVSSIRNGYLQTTAPISPGSSGGGLFDEQVRLVGLTTLYLDDSQQLNFAIPVEWVRELPARHDEPAAWQAAVEYGRLALNRLEKDISARDPAWSTCKRDIVSQRILALEGLHPSQVTARAMLEYNRIEPALCQAPATDNSISAPQRGRVRALGADEEFVPLDSAPQPTKVRPEASPVLPLGAPPVPPRGYELDAPLSDAPGRAPRRGQRLVDALTGVDREGAYIEGLRMRAELDRVEAETELARSTADLARTEEESRRSHEEFVAMLARDWERMGLPVDEARSIAATFQWTEQQDAITGSVRRNGLEATVRDIGAAYRAYNYLLANQLLVAYIVVHSEQADEERGGRDRGVKSLLASSLGGHRLRARKATTSVGQELLS
jgi:hypothetical protein